MRRKAAAKTDATVLAWHFVGATLRDGRPVPPDGEWLVHDGPLVMCESGLHASEHVFDALQYALGATLCRVELRGVVRDAHEPDKVVARERRIVARMDATALLRDFARQCAVDVLHLWDAPQVVRDYLTTGDASLRATARAAASAAASAAAWAAARDAAWTAEWATASAAAWATARAAASDAASAAASAAAWAAARDAARDAARAAEWAAEWATASAAAWATARAAEWAAEWATASDAASAAASAAAWAAARDAQRARLAVMVDAVFAPLLTGGDHAA